MVMSRDLPPHHSAASPPRDHAPPEDDHPNPALLKADINAGLTGDKNEVLDPGMAMVGTCEEAAGTPLTREQLKTARIEETRHRWPHGRKSSSAAHNKSNQGMIWTYGSFLVLVALAFVGGIVWLG
jgi:hypothetical protein